METLEIYLALIQDGKKKRFAAYYLKHGVMDVLWYDYLLTPEERLLSPDAKKHAEALGMHYNARWTMNNLPLCYYEGRSKHEVALRIINAFEKLGREVRVFYLGGSLPSEL